MLNFILHYKPGDDYHSEPALMFAHPYVVKLVWEGEDSEDLFEDFLRSTGS